MTLCLPKSFAKWTNMLKGSGTDQSPYPWGGKNTSFVKIMINREAQMRRFLL